MQRSSALVCAVMLPLMGAIAGCREEQGPPQQQQTASGYSFEQGYPTGNAAQRSYADNEIGRASCRERV